MYELSTKYELSTSYEYIFMYEMSTMNKNEHIRVYLQFRVLLKHDYCLGIWKVVLEKQAKQNIEDVHDIMTQGLVGLHF